MNEQPDKQREAERNTERAPRPRPGPVDLSEESVAGEEDPGAALDVTEKVPMPPREPPEHNRRSES